MKRIPVLFVSILLLVSFGCTGELVPRNGSGGDGPDAGGGGNPAAEQFFLANVQPLLQVNRPLGSCAKCHQGDGNGEVGGVGPILFGQTALDNYAALVANTRLVSPGNPAGSVLITHGAHTGDAFPPADIQVVESWILME